MNNVFTDWKENTPSLSFFLSLVPTYMYKNIIYIGKHVNLSMSTDDNTVQRNIETSDMFADMIR